MVTFTLTHCTCTLLVAFLFPASVPFHSTPIAFLRKYYEIATPRNQSGGPSPTDQIDIHRQGGGVEALLQRPASIPTDILALHCLMTLWSRLSAFLSALLAAFALLFARQQAAAPQLIRPSSLSLIKIRSSSGTPAPRSEQVTNRNLGLRSAVLPVHMSMILPFLHSIIMFPFEAACSRIPGCQKFESWPASRVRRCSSFASFTGIETNSFHSPFVAR